MLGCFLFNKNLQNDPKKTEIHIIIEIKRNKSGFDFKIEDLVEDKTVISKCHINLWHTVKSKSNEKYLVKPFEIVYHVPSSGYFMRSSTQEWLQIFDDKEISRDMKVTNTICQTESKTLILRYQKELKEKKKVNQEQGLKTWSKVVLMVINLDSKAKANNRIITRIEKEEAFSLDTEQSFEAFYLQQNSTLVIGNTGQLSNLHRLYYSTYIDMKYPRIMLSTNSSQDFTAEMRVFLDYQSATREGAYGFPFKIEAKTPKKFELKPLKEIPALKNGKHNLEEYFNISGPVNSIQQISEEKTKNKICLKAILASNNPSGRRLHSYSVGSRHHFLRHH